MLAKPRYQLIVLGARAPSYRRLFTRALRSRLDEIGTGLSRTLKLLDAAHATDLDPISPAVGIWFGDDPACDAVEAEILVAAAVPILPVVSDIERFQASVPKILAPINGMALNPAAPDFQILVNLVLENLGLLRRRRRLFLSYRRTESTPVAQQLRVAFDQLGYDAFLDSCSVPKGDDFQQVLHHRLLDSDVMIVLDTPGFLESYFTQFEITEASAMSIGILQVLWPTTKRADYSLLSTPLRLRKSDFDGEQLTPATIARVTGEIERLRARCLAARHTNLVVEFCAEARRAGAHVTVQPERFVLAELGGRRIAAVPAVGVPGAELYHEASKRFPAGNAHADDAVLIYDHRGMQPEWKVFLGWLDDFLPVRGLPVTDTLARLKA